MNRRVVALVLAFLAPACGDDEPDAIYARLRNDTEFDFTRLTVSGALEVGPLPAGTTSDYQRAEPGALYALEVGTAETVRYRFFGMLNDRTGDIPLGNGHYTYDVFAEVSGDVPGYNGRVVYDVTDRRGRSP